MKICYIYLGVLEEAKFFGLESLVKELEEIVVKDNSVSEDEPLKRSDVIKSLMICEPSQELRFQAFNLMGADLSKLDLRKINFKVFFC